MKNTRTRTPQDRPGFTLFLVLVILFLMMMLCITYLRVMRMSSTQNVGSTGNVASVLARLQQDLRILVGADGNLNVYEPHDYPWTCTRANAPCQLTYPYQVKSNAGMGDPKVDDTWLSPIEPESGKWAQVTNLYGSFLNYSDKHLDNIPVNLNTRARVPADAPAGRMIDGMANNQFVAFQDLDVTDPRLVDADGDGEGDSLWCYPPESLQGDLRYIVAVRIIDASGLLNLNTALGEFGQAPNTRGIGTPRKGEGAYEIDARSLLGAMPATSKTFRQGGIVSGPSGRAPADWSNWDYHWASGGRTTDTGGSSAANRYGAEAKLRDHFNDYADNGSPEAQIWRDYPTLGNNAGNRKYVTTVGGIRDVYAPLPYAPDRDPNAAAFSRARRPFDLYGEQNNINIPAAPSGYPPISGGVLTPLTNGGWWDQAQFYLNNGSSAVNNGYGVSDFLVGIDANAYTNAALTTNTDSDLTYPFPAGFRYALRNQGATWWARPLVFQRQMACNIAAALGRDNVTRRDYYNEWSGWEPLPVLTEFYAQMPYVMMSPSFLPATPTTAVVFPGRNIADFASASDLEFPILGGASFSNICVPGTVYHFINDGTTITAQIQAIGGTNTLCCKIQLTKVGSDIVGSVLYAKFGATASFPLGYNFDLGGTDRTPIATAYNGANWGVSLGQATTNGSIGGNYSAMFWNTTARRSAAATPVDVTYGATDWRSKLSAGGASAGVGSYAFELANPYAFPVRLCNLRFQFKRHDYHTPFEYYAFGGTDINGAAIPAAPANAAHGTSADLGSYVDALGAPPSYTDSGGTAQTMLRDAEGYWVLRPGERVVFYRNGFDGPKAGGTARNKPFGGSPDVSGLIAPNTCYTVDLGADPAVPDLNGHPATWKVEYFEIQTRNQDRSGSVYAEASPTSYNGQWNYNTWVPWQHVVYRTLPSGWSTSANNCEVETNIPAGRQLSPGDLVYRQVDVRTFGVAEKLDCLQARPPKYPAVAWSTMPTDLGDHEYRTNYYKGVVSGTLASRVFPPAVAVPAVTGWPSAGWANLFYDNLPSTLELGSFADVNCFQYNSSIKNDLDPVHPDMGAISALGRAGKVGWEQAGPDGALGTGDDWAGGPNGLMAAYGTPTPPALTNRQRIRDEIVNWNYVGLPDDPNYPGTFPELTAANNANKDIRNNTMASGAVKTRRDGLPRTLDLLKVPLVSNFVYYNMTSANGNASYRGITSGNWAAMPQSTSPWIGSSWQNTIGDALNFYLLSDTQKLGLRGLCLRTDAKWFDWANAGTKYKVYNGATPYPLAYDAATPYVAGMETLSGGDIYQAQQAMTGTAPDPTPVTGNVGPAGSGKAWAYSNGPYARASQFWQLSWGELLASRWQVDSPKYMGDTGVNGDNWKPGMINLNTAPKSVLQCLSLPTGASSAIVADKIIAMRKAPLAGAAVGRKGLVLASEAFGDTGLKSYTTNTDLLTAGSGTAKFYTSDAVFNLETLAWLPQQATCRSDAFIAYVVVQGYHKDNFNLGPMEVARQILVLTRDGTGGAGTLVGGAYTVPRK